MSTAWLTPLTSPAAWSAQNAQCSVASIFATLVTAIVTKGLQRAQREYDRTKDITKDEYDFVVVGAGSAGCAVAARLSEVPSWKVLLLEAGGEETDYGIVPALYNRYLNGPLVDWGYSSQPSHGWDQGMGLQRGKGLGGSSAVNAMHFTRGNPADFDRWPAGWKYKDVLPYFRKSENNLDPEMARDRVHHGTGGPQDVQIDKFVDPNVVLYMDGFEELGYPRVKDVNGAHQLGVSLAPSSVGNGERRSTNRAYLQHIRSKRPNLTVQTHATVQRVLLSKGKRPRAVGVEFIGPGGKRRAVRARKEVILSGGAYNSPHLLMLSGVGPRAHLEKAKVAVRVDLPGVGQRLHDHHFATGIARFELSKTRADLGTVQQRIADLKQYLEKRTGPFVATVNQANMFLRTKYQAKNDPRPDIQMPLGVNLVETNVAKGCLGGDFGATYGNRLSFNAINLHPKSRGRVLLNATDPTSAPLIYNNVFADQSDLLPIIEAFKVVKKLNATSVFQRNGITLTLSVPYACQKLDEVRDAKAYWPCFFRQVGKSNGHPVGTCSMGPDGDRMAVLNSRLQVRGVDGLRVVDASAAPEASSGNTNAVVIMIGEKGADLIKGDWLKRRRAGRKH